jgi:hypothetical protein
MDWRWVCPNRKMNYHPTCRLPVSSRIYRLLYQPFSGEPLFRERGGIVIWQRASRCEPRNIRHLKGSHGGSVASYSPGPPDGSEPWKLTGVCCRTHRFFEHTEAELRASEHAH